MSTTRDKLYQHFGPMLTESIVDVILAELNSLRKKNNLKERTKQQFIDNIKTKNDALKKYDWMKEEPAKTQE